MVGVSSVEADIARVQLHALRAKLHAKQDLQLARASRLLQIILANFRAAEEAGFSEEETAAVTAEQNDLANSGDNMRRSTAKDTSKDTFCGAAAQHVRRQSKALQAREFLRCLSKARKLTLLFSIAAALWP